MLRKLIFVSVLICISVITGIGLIFNKTVKLEESFEQISFNQSTVEDSIYITFIGVGDIMLGSNYPSRSYLPPNDGLDILKDVKNVISSANFSFGNLEGVFLSEEIPPAKKCNDSSICYTFKMPDHYVKYIKEAGFNMLSLANNHINDFGSKGINNTIKLLSENSIHFAGLRTHPYTIIEQDGIRVGFTAFGFSRNVNSINDYQEVRKIVSHLDSLTDIVVVSFHGGGEGKRFRRITKQREFFLEENRGNPYEFSRVAIDAGADIVFGHGPHVTRGIDLYKNRLICYSLGNFATYGLFNISGVNGIAPIMKVRVAKSGDFVDAEVISIQQIKRGIPRIDDSHKAYGEIIELTNQDIPNHPFVFKKDGRIILKDQQ